MSPRREGATLSSLLVVTLTLAACRPAPTASPDATASSQPAASSPVVTAVDPGAWPACSPDGASVTWPSIWADAMAPGGSDVVPVIVSSQVSVGPQRLLYTLTNSQLGVIAAPDLATRVRLYALDRDAQAVVADVLGTFLDTGTDRGLYRAQVEFDCAGTWGAEIETTAATGETGLVRTVFRVRDADSTPAIGAPAPRSDSITASTPEEVRRISTDPEPDVTAYRISVAEAVSSGRPSVIFFATPGFCQSGVCGPTVEMVKAVVAGYRGDLEFVIVEPYRLVDTPNGPQADLDAAGHLKPVQAALDYGLVAEPYLFVVDAEGNVTAKFEVVVGEDELRGALEDVTSKPHASEGEGSSPA